MYFQRRELNQWLWSQSECFTVSKRVKIGLSRVQPLHTSKSSFDNWDEDYFDDDEDFPSVFFGDTEDVSYKVPNEEEESQIPYLEKFGIDLTLLAAEGRVNECFGRDEELLAVMEILVRRQKNNPVLIGDAGVGKTAIVELFATRLVRNNVPFVLQGRRIIGLDLARIVAGSRYRGEFELRFRRILDEVLEEPQIIVFIDEIHNINGAGSAEGSLDAANILKPVLSRSGFQCIGATTVKEYERLEKDPALNRRFQAVKVEEPTLDQTKSILYYLRPIFESYHNVVITEEAILSAVNLTHRYIYDRFLPDKAIDLIDRTCAKEVIRMTSRQFDSVLENLVNTSLVHLGVMKSEAFRKGDIPLEFILQEVENAYRNFLLRWIHEPETLPSDPLDPDSESGLTPLSQDLYNQMRLAMLENVEDLLFTTRRPGSNYPIYHPKRVVHIDNLSFEKASQINFTVDQLLLVETKVLPRQVSVSRLQFWLAGFWLKESDDNELIGEIDLSGTLLDDEKSDHSKVEVKRRKPPTVILGPAEEMPRQPYDDSIPSEARPWSLVDGDQDSMDFQILDGVFYFDAGNDFYDHLIAIRELIENQEIINFEKSMDFCFQDAEPGEQVHRYLSELEVERWNVFRGYLSVLEPLVDQTMLDSVFPRPESSLTLDHEEESRIYDLLGYFSTKEGHQRLIHYDDPDLLRRARSSGEMDLLKSRVTEQKIQIVLSGMTGIPMESLTTQESQKLLGLENTLHKRVVGQERAISAVSKAIRRARLGIQNPNRPLASFMFCGPTGVGKTEVTKALAEALFGSESSLIRFDMSEFMDKFTVSRLIGSPPGYIGYEEGGQLTDLVRNKPYSVVLFDEVEKAHPDVLNLLLQILEDGRLTDTQKRLVKFTNTLVIMTSNAGSEDILNFVQAPEFKQCIEEDDQIEERIKERKRIRQERKKAENIRKAETRKRKPKPAPEPKPKSKSEFEAELESGSRYKPKYKRMRRRWKNFENWGWYAIDRRPTKEEKYGITIEWFSHPIRGDLFEFLREKILVNLEAKNAFDGVDDYEEFIKLVDPSTLPKKEEAEETDFREGSQKQEKTTVDYAEVRRKEKEEAEEKLLLKKDNEERTLNLQQREKLEADLKKLVISNLTTFFLPEFLNRLDDIIVFQPLSPEELVLICDIMVANVAKRVLEKNIELNVHPAVRRYLAYESHDPAYGARPLRRAITRKIEDRLVDNLLEYPIVSGTRLLTFSLTSENDIEVDWDGRIEAEKAKQEEERARVQAKLEEMKAKEALDMQHETKPEI